FSNRHNEEAFSKYLFVFAGAVDLHTLTSGANSPLNICEKMFLHDLSASGVRQLTDLLGARGLYCAPAVSDYIYSKSGGHPYLTQRLCSILEANVEGAITREDVDCAVSEILHADDNLDHITRQLDGDAEARALTKRIVVAEDKLTFSRVNPLVGKLETMGIIRAANGVCKVRNDIYVRALRLYFGQPAQGRVPVKRWMRRALIPLGISLVLLFLPTTWVYARDVLLAPALVRHQISLSTPDERATITHPTVIHNLSDTPLSVDMQRTLPASSVKISLSSDDPEIIIVNGTRVLGETEQHAELTLQLSQRSIIPNFLNPFAGRHSVRLQFLEGNAKPVESVEEFHTDYLTSLGFVGTLIMTLSGVVMFFGELMSRLEKLKMFVARAREMLGEP
ncbi:MAG: AAA-like domain-containing protein, partial [Chloroflexi bacterium]|nr:AAA-like domain-containing protein [Chloroflexota bacterium]